MRRCYYCGHSCKACSFLKERKCCPDCSCLVPRRRVAKPSYQRAVEWVAQNDESAEIEVSEVSKLVSVLLVGDLFGKHELEVAEDVVRHRSMIQL